MSENRSCTSQSHETHQLLQQSCPPEGKETVSERHTAPFPRLVRLEEERLSTESDEDVEETDEEFMRDFLNCGDSTLGDV